MPHAMRLGDPISSAASRAYRAEPAVQNSYIDTAIVFQLLKLKDGSPSVGAYRTFLLSSEILVLVQFKLHHYRDS